MEQKALDMITERLDGVLSAQGYKLTQTGKAGSNLPSLFMGETVAYALVYDKKQKRFELRQSALDDKHNPGDWSNVSAWLFDPNSDTLKDAESIANDFCESVTVETARKQVAQRKTKKEKNDDKYVNPAFLMNRFIPIFPEMKFVVRAHREKYGAIIPHAMCREFVVPLMNELLKAPDEKQRQSRFFDVLSQNYKNGDLDTKSLITLGILNQIDGEAQQQLAESMISDELKTAWKCARKYKNKKVRPEKVKRRAQLSAEKSTGSLL